MHDTPNFKIEITNVNIFILSASFLKVETMFNLFQQQKLNKNRISCLMQIDDKFGTLIGIAFLLFFLICVMCCCCWIFRTNKADAKKKIKSLFGIGELSETTNLNQTPETTNGNEEKTKGGSGGTSRRNSQNGEKKEVKLDLQSIKENIPDIVKVLIFALSPPQKSYHEILYWLTIDLRTKWLFITIDINVLFFTYY